MEPPDQAALDFCVGGASFECGGGESGDHGDAGAGHPVPRGWKRCAGDDHDPLGRLCHEHRTGRAGRPEELDDGQKRRNLHTSDCEYRVDSRGKLLQGCYQERRWDDERTDLGCSGGDDDHAGGGLGEGCAAGSGGAVCEPRLRGHGAGRSCASGGDGDDCGGEDFCAFSAGSGADGGRRRSE